MRLFCSRRLSKWQLNENERPLVNVSFFLAFFFERIPGARLALLLAEECHAEYLKSPHKQQYTFITLSDYLYHIFVAWSSM
jgi:hypothetical protein